MLNVVLYVWYVAPWVREGQKLLDNIFAINKFSAVKTIGRQNVTICIFRRYR
jgi:hypothetical protein